MRRSIPIAVVCLLVAIAGICRAETVPGYSLHPGQEIQYDGTSTFKFENGQFDDETKVTLWVTRSDPTAGWHVIVRSSQVSKDSRFKGDEKPRVSFTWFDVSRDGTMRTDPHSLYLFDPSSIFIKLPTSASELTMWTDHNAQTDTDSTFLKIDSDDSKLFRFKGALVRMYDKIYGFDTQLTVTFDREQGLITEIDRTLKQTYGFNGTGSATMKLKSVKMSDPEWLATFVKETDAAFNIAHFKAGDRDDVKTIQTQMDKEAAEVRAALATMTLPETKQILEDRLKDLQRSQSSIIADAKVKAEVQAAAPADWTAKDLDGKQHALKDYRGKIVLLDYWYRGCGWCMRAMPQIKEVAEKYKDNGVVVFGMNTDSDLSDAKFVVDTMKLNYTTLQAKDLVDTYKVNNFGFPTLIVIDQTGKVNTLHVGYSATLKEDLSKIIDGLLKKNDPS
jgi:thiol-disulfide isomerase/thioredoxin